MSLPSGPFDILLADPPWSFATYSDKGRGRAADQHYDTMSLTDIERMDVAGIAAFDAVLFMWATSPMLPEATQVMRKWGFSYRGGSRCLRSGWPSS